MELILKVTRWKGLINVIKNVCVCVCLFTYFASSLFYSVGFMLRQAFFMWVKNSCHHFKNYIILIASDTREATGLLRWHQESSANDFDCSNLIPVTITDWITMFYNGELWLASLGHVSWVMCPRSWEIEPCDWQNIIWGSDHVTESVQRE